MRTFKDIPDDAIRGIGAPTLVVVGDADVMRPAHRSLVLAEKEPDRLLNLLAKARPCSKSGLSAGGRNAVSSKTGNDGEKCYLKGLVLVRLP